MAALPTMQVRLRASGSTCLINATDFDPALHARLDEPPEGSTSTEEERPVRRRGRALGDG